MERYGQKAGSYSPTGLSHTQLWRGMASSAARPMAEESAREVRARENSRGLPLVSWDTLASGYR